MDPGTAAQARSVRGVVPRTALGTHPSRSAGRHELVRIQPAAFVARTQPVDQSVHLAALTVTRSDRDWSVMAEGALWLYGVGEAPDVLVVGVPASHTLATADPVVVRRVAACVLDGSRSQNGCQVVALEIAVIQVAKQWSTPAVRELVEELVRGRRTTLTRLRARCVRGLAGSARVRQVCDDLAGGSMERDVRRLKAALERLGVTDLECEQRFRSDAGASAYGDLLHRPTRTVIEVDGLLDHAQRSGFRRDRRRDRWMLRQHGVVTLRVDVLEVREDVDALAAELAWFLLPSDDQVAG